MKKVIAQTTLSLALVLTVVGYGQPYEPEHLLHLCGQAGVHERFGSDIMGVGDVNADACEDFVVSMIIGPPAEGTFSAFYGGSPPDSIADIIFQNPYSHGDMGFDADATNIGDVNGDGYDDIGSRGAYSSEDLIRVFIYYGGCILDTIPDKELGHAFGDGFGGGLYGLGDANGDGFEDIGVCGPSYQQSTGKVWVYFGGNPMDTIPDWEKQGTADHTGFGYTMAGGDLNGDGYSDFVIGGHPQPYEWHTNYYVFLGGAELDTVPEFVIEGGNYPGYQMGQRITIIDDLNGDRFADLLITCGIPRCVLVFFGGFPFNITHDVALLGMSGASDYDRVSRAGDVNADGYGDIIVGQNGNEGVFGGKVLVYFGGSWVNPSPMMVWTGWSQPWEGCGERVCDPGDINGDGVDDIMFASFNSFNRPGCVDIWEGDSDFVAGVGDEAPGFLVKDFHLQSPYPNPFNQSLTIPLQVHSGISGKMSLKIYNVLGLEVMDLAQELTSSLTNGGSGSISVAWNGRDRRGLEAGSGIYLIAFRLGSSLQVRKAVLLR